MWNYFLTLKNGLENKRNSTFQQPKAKVAFILVEFSANNDNNEHYILANQPKELQLLCFLILSLCLVVAMLQADDEDEMMEMQMKSPFGSSFRTFNATDYKPIGKIF